MEEKLVHVSELENCDSSNRNDTESARFSETILTETFSGASLLTQLCRNAYKNRQGRN